MGLGLFRSAKRRKKMNKTAGKKKLQKDWEDLLKRHGIKPGERLDLSNPRPLKDTLTSVLARHADRLTTHIPSAGLSSGPIFRPPKPVYEGDMAAREAAAQSEIQRKKSMVAPLYNKGPAAYVAGYDPKDLGRK